MEQRPNQQPSENVETAGRDLPRNVCRKGRKGYLYFIKRGAACQRMPDDPQSPEFRALYEELVARYTPDKPPKEDRRRAKRLMPSRKSLHRIFRYEPSTGTLHWHNDGSSAETPVSSGRYKSVRFMGMQWLSHRVIWKMFTGQEPDDIDHINGNGLDNRFSNLRSVSPVENGRNRALAEPKHGKHGVRPYGSRWMAKAGTQYLGLFARYEDAVAAREAAERALGFHENHGRQRN